MYQFTAAVELLKLCKKYKAPISEIVIRYEMEFTNKSREEIIEKMRKTKNVMQEAVEKGIQHPELAAFKMSGGNAPKIYKHKNVKNMILNPIAIQAMAYATATGETNAAMGRIAAFPTAGGSGVVPGAIISAAKEWNVDEDTFLRGLFTAAGTGLIIAEKATLSAAAGGCQAEVGAAMAMAASGITEMRGGKPDQCCNAAALALKSYLGVACDPLGGLVAVPCIKRNALGTVVAYAASDLTMAGVQSFVPFDEVVFAMRNIGKMMSYKIRETALGGLAVTKTGLKIRKELGLPDLKPAEIDG